MMLEFSQYLENYLWPNYTTDKSSYAHMMSIVVMLNEKFRERVPLWQVILFFSIYFHYIIFPFMFEGVVGETQAAIRCTCLTNSVFIACCVCML